MAILHVVLCWISAALLAVRSEIPDGYILQVKPHCGADGVEDASIKIVTDLQISANAVCEGLIEAPFASHDTVNFNLPVSYPGHGSSPCVFHKRRDSRLFFLKVVISHGPYNNGLAAVHEEEEEYTLTCTFGLTGANGTSTYHVPEGMLAPLEVQSNVGVAAASAVLDLQLLDVLGGDLSGVEIYLERKIWLRAVSSGALGEVGLKPVSCDAIGMTTNKSYAVLRAGCGDGIVFAKDEGFNTSGLEVRSPYFAAFNMAGDPLLRFECNFTMCNESCDGSSCENEFKRSIVTNELRVVLPVQTARTVSVLARARRTKRSLLQRIQNVVSKYSVDTVHTTG